ncbi:hypothetical protein PRIPAC_96546, partial [Pristionchus pacificus]|uniref:Uncharacterized protein n=1 Tax=Pristionchus pacificus TaxID=54126 RepID=A0A2A6D202_PRIPA
MPWPSHQPTLTVPYRETYKAVNLNAPPSEQTDGLDLPFNDISTLRFFYNIGVQQSRAILLSQLHYKLAIGLSNQPAGVASEGSQLSSYTESNQTSLDSSMFSWPCSDLMNVPCE